MHEKQFFMIAGVFVYRHNVLNKIPTGEALVRFFHESLAYKPGKSWEVAEKRSSGEQCPIQTKKKDRKSTVAHRNERMADRPSPYSPALDSIWFVEDMEIWTPPPAASLQSVHGNDDSRDRRKQKMIPRTLADHSAGDCSSDSTTDPMPSTSDTCTDGIIQSIKVESASSDIETQQQQQQHE